MERFTGTVELLGAADPSAVIAWISAIPFEDWPQQTRLEDGRIRPAMVNDPEWHGFGRVVAPVVAEARSGLAGTVSNVLLTVVMPGHNIPTHTDQQPPHWVTRVHIPLTTNEESRFIVGAEHHHMEIGSAYLVNTEVEHSVANDGATPRIHLMFDFLA